MAYLKLRVSEAINEKNSRTDIGRVIIDPPKKMGTQKSHFTGEQWYFCCCGRAFMSKQKLTEHSFEHEKDAAAVKLETTDMTDVKDEEIIKNCDKSDTKEEIFKTEIDKVEIKEGKEDEDFEDGISGISDVSTKVYEPITVSNRKMIPRIDNVISLTTGEIGTVIEPRSKRKRLNNAKTDTADDNKENVRKKPAMTQNFVCQHQNCQRTFTHEWNLRMHLKHIHSPEAIKPRRKKKGSIGDKCTSCHLKFKNLKRHIKNCRSQIPDNSFKCDKCSCLFKSEIAKMFHLKLYHKNESEVISNQKKTINILKIPIKMELKKEKQDNYNDKRIKLEKEKQNINNEHLCTQCNKVFSTANCLRQHLLLHSEVRAFSCNKCDLGFTRKDLFIRHQNSSHVINGIYKCPHCPCTFSDVRIFKMHSARIHKESLKKNNYPKKATTPIKNTLEKEKNINPKQNLKIKFQLKIKEKSQPPKKNNKNIIYKCVYCRKRFDKKAILWKHAAEIHQKQFIIECSSCNLSFSAKHSYTQHSKTSHNIDGKWNCMYCSCRFLTSSSLSVHKGRYH